LVRLEDAGDEAQERRLAAAVVAQHDDGLRTLTAERDTIEDLFLAEAFFEIAD
jgi:hypothetical protein